MKEHNNRKKANQFAEYITGSELRKYTAEEEESKIVVHSEPNGKCERTPFNYTLFKHLRKKDGFSVFMRALPLDC